MKKFLKIGIFLVVFCLIFSSCSVLKSDEELIEDRISAFLSAYNAGDMDDVLKCMDAKTRNMYQGMMNIAQGLGGIGFGVSDLFAVGVGTTSDGDLLSVDILDIQFQSEDEATVLTALTYRDKYHEDSDRTVFTMIKEDGDWFIADMEDE